MVQFPKDALSDVTAKCENVLAWIKSAHDNRARPKNSVYDEMIDTMQEVVAALGKAEPVPTDTADKLAAVTAEKDKLAETAKARENRIAELEACIHDLEKNAPPKGFVQKLVWAFTH